MRYVLHMTDLGAWAGADGDIAPESLRTEGFVHASPDDGTLLAVANARYAHADGPQVALVVDTHRLDAEIRWEAPVPAPPPGAAPDVLFPHVYGPIPRDAVVEVRHLRRDAGGTFVAVE